MQEDREKLLETFRIEIIEALLTRGVSLPEQNSDAENRLFEQWLKGHEKLQQLKKDIKNVPSSN